MIGTDLTGLVIAFVAGAAMGAGYFAGLWLTLCHMAKASSPTDSTA
ncbi:MAG: ATP synthase subunit I [Syntrophotaleaceae bacterium]